MNKYFLLKTVDADVFNSLKEEKFSFYFVNSRVYIFHSLLGFTVDLYVLEGLSKL